MTLDAIIEKTVLCFLQICIWGTLCKPSQRANLFTLPLSTSRVCSLALSISTNQKIIFRSELYRVYTAEMLMQKPQVTLNTEDSMSTIMDKFQKCDAGTLPVLKSDGKFVGFVSRTHLYASYRQIMKDFSEE